MLGREFAGGILTARKHLLGDDLARGVVYASDQTHHFVAKVASLAGVPEGNICLLETDERCRADLGGVRA